MLSGMMDLKKMKSLEKPKRGSIGPMILKKIRHRKRKNARTLPLKKATLQGTILHAKSQRENDLRANMNPTLTRSRSRLRKRRKRNTIRMIPILKAPPVTTQARRKVRRKGKKVTFYRIGTRTRTRKLTIGGTASPSPRNTINWKLSALMTYTQAQAIVSIVL